MLNDSEASIVRQACRRRSFAIAQDDKKLRVVPVHPLAHPNYFLYL
ncbi:hypothetical protein [Mucilaginibacter lappiensis]|uniref:Uncharacterized protein n=1 Tax=Mucilaginibacter lappiensis TaxID=354630 RepID=A0A841JLL6_9SPHI|nr:hypothetical protein [Mucilaginibacter lappiensis]MBB6129608.1 hypothetical protein [Mucilaginibacter lappiensis]